MTIDALDPLSDRHIRFRKTLFSKNPTLDEYA